MQRARRRQSPTKYADRYWSWGNETVIFLLTKIDACLDPASGAAAVGRSVRIGFRSQGVQKKLSRRAVTRTTR